MFNRGDKALYGQTGVCIVEQISEKSFDKNLKLLHLKTGRADRKRSARDA